MSRLPFIAAGALVLGMGAFAAGVHAAKFRTGAYEVADQAMGLVRSALTPAGRQRLSMGLAAEHVQPARRQGAGVTVNARPDDGALVMIAGYFDGGNEIRLIRRDGTPVRRWPISYSALFPEIAKADLSVDLHGTLLMPEGDPVFNIEYHGAARLDRCGAPVWTIPQPLHHSVELAEAGGFWIPGRNAMTVDDPAVDRFTPFTQSGFPALMLEDLILHVSDDGQVLSWKSVPEILYDNALEPLMTATGNSIRSGLGDRDELVHVNKIAELSSDLAPAFPMFAAGDLAISMRELNLIIVVEPGTWTVKWHSIGPWRRQHDPEFQPNGRIGVFNNNVYGIAYDAHQWTRLDWPRVTNIMEIDPATGETEVVFGERPGQEMLSVIRGKHEILPDGGRLITEFDAGRVIETDADGTIVWEYVNAVDADFVGELTEARLYPADYFEVTDWSCP